MKTLPQCDTGQLEFIFIINHLGYMSPKPSAGNECRKSKCLSILSVHEKSITITLTLVHFNIIFCRNRFPISSIINTYYHPSIGKMCYYVKRPPEFSFITNHLPSMSP